MNKIKVYLKIVVTAALLGVMFSGCARPAPPQPSALVEPPTIMDNSGEFMCPYTQDGVLAEWTDNAVSASAASNIGGAVGAYAGSRALGMIPIVGGFLGQKAGEAIGRKIAVEACGGEEFIKGSSDISFNRWEDLSVYIYKHYSTNPHFANALEATQGIYPEMKQGYMQAIMNAPRQ